MHEYEGTYLKFVVTTTGEGANLKATCTVIDLRKVRKEEVTSDA